MRRESRGESELYNEKLAEATFAYRESLAKALAKEKWSIQDSSNCLEHRSNVRCRLRLRPRWSKWMTVSSRRGSYLKDVCFCFFFGFVWFCWVLFSFVGFCSVCVGFLLSFDVLFSSFNTR